MKQLKQFLACVLALVMLLGLVPAQVLAAEPAQAAASETETFAYNDPDAHKIFTTHQGNPYLPPWEYIPDGEPHVFEDPDNPGEYRVYVYGSHDTRKTNYCGYDLVTWSAPVDDLSQWRYDGIIFESAAYGTSDLLYAPDIAEITDPDTGKKTYYLYPNNQTTGRTSMVAKSDRPDGPFEVCNWEDDNHTRTTGPIGFDPAVLVDDDGRVYAYWDHGEKGVSAAELDPETMATVRPGTEIKENMIPGTSGEGDENDPADPQGFRFYEASSIRKIDGMYVFVYCRFAKSDELAGHNCLQLAYAYSENPLGPWTYGGPVVDARGEVTNAETHAHTFSSGNIHGGMCKINGQWYIFYHRAAQRYARQAMAEPIDVKVDTVNKTVTIKQAEMTSSGFSLNGLDPYRRQLASIACYMVPNSTYIQPVYDKSANSQPIVNIQNESVIGYKYFNFDVNPAEGQSTQLELELKPLGRDADIDVYLRPTTAVNTPVEKTDGVITSVGKGSYKVGSFHLRADMPQEYTTVRAAVPQVDEVSGKWGVFLVFRGAANTDLCELYSLQFLNGEAELRDSFDGDLAKWEAKDASVADGSVALNAGGSILANDGERWSGYALNADVAEQSGALHFRLLQTDEENYYELTVQDGRLQLTSTVYGVTKTVGSAEIGVQAPYRLIVDAADGVLSVRVNGALRLAVRNTDHAAGTVGVIADGGAKFNEINIERATFTPPADRLAKSAPTNEITVDGQPLENFSQDVESYQMIVSDDRLPVVAGSSSDPTTAISVAQAQAVPGSAFVHFISATGEVSSYTINFGKTAISQKYGGLSALPDTWEYLNENAIAKENVTFDDKGIVLSTQNCPVSGGEDYPFTGSQSYPAISMKQNLTGDWTVDVKISADKALNASYPAYGLGLYVDNRNYVKSIIQGRSGQQYVQLYTMVDGSRNEQKYSCPDMTNWMRISKDGNFITVYRSSDGQDYQKLMQTTVSDAFESAKLQFYATKTGSEEDFKAWLESLQLTLLSTSAPSGDQADVDAAVIAIGPIIHIDGAANMNAGQKLAAARALLEKNETLQSLGVSCALAQSGDGFSLTLTKGDAVLTLPQIELSERVTDWTALQAKLAEARKYTPEDDYTFATWNKLQSAIEQAAACPEDATPLEIVEAYERLMQAIAHLEKQPDTSLEDAQAAAAAAQAAAEAAKVAQAAADDAAASTAADKTAAEAAQKAAQDAQTAAKDAQAAAEKAAQAAKDSDTAAAAKAAAAADDAAKAAKSASDAATAQAAAQAAQGKAEDAQKAAEAAQTKADEAASKGEGYADEAKAAQDAADKAKTAAESAKTAAEAAKAAADASNTAAAQSAADAAASAAQAADALKQVAEAQIKVAEDRAAAEAAAKAAQEAELSAARYLARMKLTVTLAGFDTTELPEEQAEQLAKLLIDASSKIDAAKSSDEIDKVMVDTLAAIAKLLDGICPSAKFTDVPAEDNWAHEGIDYCVATGLMDGVGADKFNPSGTLTRAQLVTILYRMEHEPAVTAKDTFSDVLAGQWYSNAIEWAAANKIVDGVGEGKFNPGGAITREQIATILYRYNKSPAVTGDLSKYPDSVSVSSYAKDAMNWAVEQGIVTGVESNGVTTLNPQGNANRAQIAVMLERYLNK